MSNPLERPSATLNLTAEQLSTIARLTDDANAADADLTFQFEIGSKHSAVVTLVFRPQYAGGFVPRRKDGWDEVPGVAEYLVDADGTVISAKGWGRFSKAEHEEWEAQEDAAAEKRRATAPPADDDIPF
jgi:hypothetical protein